MCYRNDKIRPYLIRNNGGDRMKDQIDELTLLLLYLT